jgi:16S rRNA (guanine527-N7)-methyltransferase
MSRLAESGAANTARPVYNLAASMEPSRIAELLEPFLGSAAEMRGVESLLSNISTYLEILLRWNARINLTAIRKPEEIVTRHFGESLFAARHLFPYPSSRGPAISAASACRVADLGSGAGFPGLPIKLWTPEISLTLIESSHKKATFLREVCRALKLSDVSVAEARAETLPPNVFDVVTLRAVERCSEVTPAASRLLFDGGRLALLIGSSQLSTVRSTLASFSWGDPIQIPLSQSRVLLIGTRKPTS